MSNSPARSLSGSAPSDLAKLLAERLGAAILPGDTPLEGEDLAEAAAFLLTPAAHRNSREPCGRC